MKRSIDDTYFRVADRTFCITGTWWLGDERTLCIREYANLRFGKEFKRREDQLPSPLPVVSVNLPPRAWKIVNEKYSDWKGHVRFF